MMAQGNSSDTEGHKGNDDQFYTPLEVAKILKVSERTIRRRLEQGELPGQRIGRQWRVPREVIDRLSAIPHDWRRLKEPPDDT